ncbi:MAG: type II secretion system minor pseudopilin GspI [Chromatiales bacterium]|jgi:general secretion pathway protein I
MRYRNIKGFTLLEVLIALSILSIALAALIKGASQYVSNQTYLEDRTFSQWVALNTMARLELNPYSIIPGKESGVEQMAGRGWAWSRTVSSTPDKNVYEALVSVSPEDLNGQSFAEIIGFIPVVSE